MTIRPLSALAFQDHVGRLEDELEAALGLLRSALQGDSDPVALDALRDRLSMAHQHARMLAGAYHALSIETDLTYE